jgi:hypothetical protein
MNIGPGGQMKKKAIMSMRVHGQMLAGRSRTLISTGKKQGWFEYEIEKPAEIAGFPGGISCRPCELPGNARR